MESSFRTLSIYDRLVNQRLKTSEEALAEEFEVTTRTINRTIKIINRFIYPQRIRKIENKKYLHVIQLTEDEMY